MAWEPTGEKCIPGALYRWDSDRIASTLPAVPPETSQDPLSWPVSSYSRPKVLYPTNGLNRPLDLSLTTEDIEGARTKKRAFTTKRCTDPLNPEYKLPTYTSSPTPVFPERVGTIPTNFILDIEKTHPRSLHRRRADPLDSLDVSDITVSRRKPVRKGESDSLDVRDINRSPTAEVRPRGTDPLDPVYLVSSLNGTALQGENQTSPVLLGPIEKSKPRPSIRSISVPPKDTPIGSSPQRYVGCLPHTSVGAGKPLYELAIPTGSRAGTLKRGMITRRKTNPLDPAYSLLDGNMDSATRILLT